MEMTSIYHIENCFVLFPICPIKFGNLLGFNWPFFPIDMGDFLKKATLKDMQKRMNGIPLNTRFFMRN